MTVDRFGNDHASGLPYARGKIITRLLFKFMPPETVARFGGPEVFAKAVAGSLDKLGSFIGDPERLRDLLLGDGLR